MKDAKSDAAVKWLFQCNGARWEWHARASDGSLVAASNTHFGSLREAIDDAELNGFSRKARGAARR